MSELNPLKFQVAIQDDATKQLEKIEEAFGKLKDQSITVKVNGLEDLQQLLSALQHQQVQNIGKDVGNAINEATKNLQREAQDAIRTSLGNLAKDLLAVKEAIQHDNFTAFSKRIENCAEAVNTLDDAFKKFHVTIGQDDGMRNFMTGLGEVIRNVRQTMGQLQVFKIGTAPTDGIADSLSKAEVVTQRYHKLLFDVENQMAKIGKTMATGELSGFSSTMLRQSYDALEHLKNVVSSIMSGKEVGGKLYSASAENLRPLLANFAMLKSSYKDVIAEAEKYVKVSEKVVPQGKVNLFSSQNTEEIKRQIDAVGALYSQIQRLEQELGRVGMAMNTISPTRWDELIRSGLYQKGVSYESQMEKLRKEQIYPGDMQKQANIIQENLDRLRRLIAAFKSEGLDVSGYKAQLDALFVTFEKFAALQPIDLGRKLGLEHLRGYTGPQSAATDATWANMKREAEIQEVAGEAAKRHQRKLEELTNAFAQHDAQLAKSQRIQDGVNQSRQQSVSTLRKQAEELVKSRMEMLRSQATDLTKLLSNGKGKLGAEQYDAVRNALRGVREEMRQIEGVMQRVGSFSIRSLFDIGRGNVNYAALISEVQRYIAEIERGSKATQQLTADEQRLAQALGQTTEHMRGQTQILSDLKSLATQYLGVWGGQQFLNNIIQIGGQLEMQRLSIGAILQNQAQANDLFDKIKRLATQSPFGVVELDQMTKQLTAYGFKYNELFDMTKRLADISAATGTGVDRLALALGHVRSEAALSGYTLRQFAMGNVPLLAKLSEKLGKSTEEIRKMVRAKQISYDDVVGVLKDLTDEGGMFHNMQEVISQSVKAKFKNVKDAMDIMYGEMAEGDIGDALKEVAEVLMKVTQNWKDAATVLGTGTAMWALHRVAVLANIATLGEHNATTLKSIAAFRAQEAQQLRTAAMYRELTIAEQNQIATSQRHTMMERMRMATGIGLTKTQKQRIVLARQELVVGEALALSSGKLRAEDIAKQVATGKLTATEARRIIVLSDLKGVEEAAALTAIKNVRTYGMFTGVVNRGAIALSRFGMALKSIIFNPATLMMAGVTALVELWQKNNQEMERASELADTIRERSNASMMSNKRIIEGSQMEFRDSEGNKVSPSHLDFQSIAHIQATMSIKFDKQDAQRQIDEWADYIRQYSATPNSIINEALFDGDKLRPIEEQYNRIAAAVGEIVKAQYGLHDLGDIFENATRATDSGWFNDDVITNINEYEEAVKDYNRAFAELYKDHGAGVDKIVKAVEKQNSAFAESVSGMSTYAEKFRHLAENWDKYTGAYDIARNEVQYSDDKLYSKLYDLRFGFDEGQERNHSREVMNEDLDIFFNHIEAEINNRGQKIGELTKAQQQDLLLGFTDFLGKTKVTTKETLDYLKKRFAERFMLTLDADDEKFQVKVNEVTRILKELSQSDWTVEMEFGSNVKDVIDEARKQYKAAKEYFEKVKPIMLKLGVEFEMGTELTEEQIEAAVAKAEPQAQEFVRNALRGVNEATKIYNNAMAASKAGGFALEDDKKKKPKGGTKAYQDEFAKRWDERIRIMKEAYGWYEKWEKKVGNDSAIAETNSKYGDIFREWKTDKVLPMDFDVTQIADYQRYVEKIRDDALARYQQQKNDKTKKNGEEALRVYRQAVALLNDIKFDNFVKAGEQFKSIIDQTIEDLNTRWDIYKTVREATGNKNLAMDVAGITGAERDVRNSADALKEDLKRQFKSLGGMAPLLEIDFDSKMDEERVRKMFENLVPDDARDKIDGLIAGFKEWQKLQKQVVKSDVSSYTGLLGLVTNYDAQIRKINDRLMQQREANNALVGTKDENGIVVTQQMADKSNQIAETQADWEKMQLSAQYANLYNNAVAMSREEFESATKAVENMISRLKELGLLTPGQAVQEQQKLDKVRTEYTTTGILGERGAVGQFISGGYESLMNYYANRRDAAQQKAERETNPDKKKEYEKEADSYGKLFKKMSAMSDTAKDVVTAFQTLQSAIDLVSTLFNSLGMDGAANASGDASNIIGGAMQGAQSLSMLGPWGMAAGAGLGLISGIAQVHDNQLAREIEALRLDVQKIESNTALILANRERTFGYDRGQLRTSYAQKDYSNQEYITLFGKKVYLDDASKDMFNYYMDNTNGNGYQQQYANLKKEREDQLQILRDQEDMKDRSESDIQETIAKISELDEQIRYFGIDLAKELWDIDVKGWADQIGDALMTAFENGEDAAKAYEDTIRSIMQSVSSNILKIGILEPMMERLNNKLFGYIDAEGKEHAGVVTTEDITSNPEKAAERLILATNEYFAKEGKAMITAAREFYVGLNDALEKGGLTGGLYNQETGNTLSSSMQGTTEETSDLMAAYLNAARQDLSVNRLLLTQFISEMWPSYIEQISSAVSSLNGINNNVAIIRELLSENGALYVMLDSMRSHLDNITNGNEQISVK